MKVTIKIAMDNAAFEEEHGCFELSRILKETADRCRCPGILSFTAGEESSSIILRDINGNRVGELKVAK